MKLEKGEDSVMKEKKKMYRVFGSNQKGWVLIGM